MSYRKVLIFIIIFFFLISGTLVINGDEKEEEIEKLLVELNSQEWKIRRDAVLDLQDYGAEAEKAIPELFKKLDDEKSDVRWAAGKALSNISGKVEDFSAETIEVVKSSLTSEQENVREVALAVAGNMEAEAKRFLPEINQILIHDNNDNMRMNSIKVIDNIFDDSEIDAEEPVKGLTMALGDKIRIAMQAEKILRNMEIPQEDQIKILLQSLNKEQSEIRLKALKAIQWIEPSAEQVLPYMKDRLQDSDDEIRKNTLQFLTSLGEESQKLVPEIAEILIRDKSRSVRRQAVQALTKIAPTAEKSIIALAYALRDDPEIASKAKETIRKNDDKKILETVFSEALEKENPVQRIAGIQGLNLIDFKPERTVSKLLILLEDKETEVRKTAVRSLGQVDKELDKEIVSQLTGLLDDPAQDVRIEVIRTLSKFDEKAEPAIPALANILSDKDDKMRREALNTIQKLGKYADTAGPVLAEILINETDTELRLKAVKTFAKMEAQRLSEAENTVMEALVLATGDINLEVRNITIDILNKEVLKKKIAEENYYSRIQTKINDEFSQIKMKTLRAIEQLQVHNIVSKNISFAEEVIAVCIDVIVSETENNENKMTAARLLGKVSVTNKEKIMDIIKNLATIPKKIRWRMSGFFNQAVQEENEVIDMLIEEAKKTDNNKIKHYLVRILSSTGSKAQKAVPLLINIVNENSNQDLRYAAARALQQISPNDSEVLELFEEAINDKHQRLRWLACQVIGVEDPVKPKQDIIAFPGAGGFGARASGGRGGEVYVVTNLNDRGPGSLRQAVEAEGPRIVIFNVSGNIMLESGLDISNPHITISGQTAPGDGITIAGYPVGISADNVILRYLRFRLGDYNKVEGDALGGRGIKNVIVDHCSMSWSTDETVSFYGNRNFTLQWSIISESLYDSVHHKGSHGYGGIWGGKGVSFHHNLLAHHTSRNPRFSGGGDVQSGEQDAVPDMVDFRNNVVYNWGFNSSYGGEFGMHNMVANYYKSGPATDEGEIQHRIVNPSHSDSKWYVTDNYVHGYPEVSADNWKKGVHPTYDGQVFSLDSIRAKEPFPYVSIEQHSAQKAYELILQDAGAVIPARDAIDNRIIEEVKEGAATFGGLYGSDSGIIDTQETVGGLPYLERVAPAVDSDSDGIPDWYVIKYGFNPKDGFSPADDIDEDGYTNIEEYINKTDPDNINWID